MGNCLTCSRRTTTRSNYEPNASSETTPTARSRNSSTSLRKSFRRQLNNLNLLTKSEPSGPNHNIQTDLDLTDTTNQDASILNGNGRNSSRPKSSKRASNKSSLANSFALETVMAPSSNTHASKTKNKPLSRNLHKPTSTKSQAENSWTLEQLQQERLEFWDTAPSYEGRGEIWLALKAAIENIHQSPPNYDLAQVIVDSAGITLPYGSFDCCYDELGTMYQIPPWVVATPRKIEKKEKENSKSRSRNTNGSTNDEEAEKFTRFSSLRNSMKSALSLKKSDANGERGKDASGAKVPRNFKFRLMNYSARISDIELEEVDPSLTVAAAKLLLEEKIQSLERAEASANSPGSADQKDDDGHALIETTHLNQPADSVNKKSSSTDKIEAVDAGANRVMTWFCAGRVLKNESRLGNCHIQDGFVIQVHVRDS